MEEASLAAGFQRIKFMCKKLGTIRDLFPDEYTYEKKFTSLAEQLAEALYIQEHHGLSPVCPDGKVGGNGAARISIRGAEEQTGLLVSKSGKYPGRMDVEQDFCIVTCFDRDTWSCEYYSNNDDARPTIKYIVWRLKGTISSVSLIHGVILTHSFKFQTI